MGLVEKRILYIFASQLIFKGDNLENRKNELGVLERDLAKLEQIKAPFPRVSYTECVDILNKIENLLRNKPFIIGNNIQFTDMAIFPLIRQFVNVDRVWFSNRCQTLTEWYLQIHSSSIFTSVMEKYVLWEDGLDPMLVNFFEKKNNVKSILKTL